MADFVQGKVQLLERHEVGQCFRQATRMFVSPLASPEPQYFSVCAKVIQTLCVDPVRSPTLSSRVVSSPASCAPSFWSKCGCLLCSCAAICPWTSHLFVASHSRKIHWLVASMCVVDVSEAVGHRNALSDLDNFEFQSFVSEHRIHEWLERFVIEWSNALDTS